jgi:hypothetical protein
MRSLFPNVRRGAAVLLVIALFLTPIAAFADDPFIKPPQPQSVLQPTQPSVWHVLLVVIASSHALPLVS